MIKYAKINVNKINKSNIKDRSFTNNEGISINVRELEIEIKDLKEEKVLLEKNGKQMVKVGFISEKSFQDGTGKWQNGAILGDVTEWREVKKDDPVKEIKNEIPEINYPAEEINVDDIPF